MEFVQQTSDSATLRLMAGPDFIPFFFICLTKKKRKKTERIKEERINRPKGERSNKRSQTKRKGELRKEKSKRDGISYELIMRHKNPKKINK